MPLLSRVIKGSNGSLALQVLEVRRLPPAMEESRPFDPVASASAQAELLVEEAQKKVRDILAGASIQAEQIVKEAQEQETNLMEEARRQGYAQGRDEALAELQEALANARSILVQAREEKRSLLMKAEKEVIDLAAEIAKKLVGKELSLSQASVLAVAREALELVANRGIVTIYVNPGDADLFRARRGELEALLSDRSELIVIADQGVKAGGLKVETEQGVVDATMEARWETLLKVLRQPSEE